jgi:tRNA modification GTPase
MGLPNAGKSSLLNALAGVDTAIVTDVPGTTRDTVTAQARLDGVPLTFIDTAGIRETNDVVEQLGVAKSKAAAEQADVVLFVLDAADITAEAMDLLNGVKKPCIVLLNKTDLVHTAQPLSKAPLAGTAPSSAQDCFWQDTFNQNQPQKTNSLENTRLPYAVCFEHMALPVCAKDGTGLDAVFNALRTLFQTGAVTANDAPFITNIRHENALQRSAQALKRAIKSAQTGLGEDIIAIDLHMAYDALGEITGETVDDGIIDQIFSQFCLGK